MRKTNPGSTRMSSFAKPGLTDKFPPTRWLRGPHGRLAGSYYPAKKPWLQVLISHGFAEHRGWWDHVARALSRNGINTFSFDHYHHGRSAGTPGDVPDYDVFASGLKLALDNGFINHKLPIVLLSHSNGGLAALHALPKLRGKIAGMVLCSPLLGVPELTLAGGWPLAWILSLFNPRIIWPVKLRPWRLTHERSIWDSYQQDPLRFHHISARFFLAMARTSREEQRRASCQGLPLLLLSAGKEQVVSFRAMQRWYQAVKTGDKHRLHYPRYCHELFNESDWPIVFNDVLDWMKARWRRRSPSRAK